MPRRQPKKGIAGIISTPEVVNRIQTPFLASVIVCKNRYIISINVKKSM
jgi:hypothetical protein